MSNDVDLQAFEGLVFATARMHDDYLDEDLDDVCQILRVTVWRALVAFEAGRVSSQPLRREEIEEARGKFVFSCVRNRVKDLLKGQARRNRRRRGPERYIEDIAGELERFPVEDLGIERVIDGDGVELLSRLTPIERELVGLLLMDYTGTEIAARLGITRKRVLVIRRSVQEKMADWRPTVVTSAVAVALLAA